MSWDDGYISQIEYVYDYSRSLSPLMIRLALLANGHQSPFDHRVRYLELGFGQGLSLNLHAVANDGEYWGNDFNPSHAINAKSMAKASGADITILEDSFAQLAARNDLPMFDIIALHGVWAWVSAENREHILKIIKSKLALGGIVYICYNTSPGNTPLIPVRGLMMQYINTASPAGGPLSEKIKDALTFVEQLMDAGAAYLDKTPIAATRLRDIIKKSESAYLAHEYFGDHWAIMSFAEVAAHLTTVGLTFCGKAKIKDFFSDSLLSPAIKNVLADIKDPLIFESVRDFCINQSYRTDLWSKGCRPLSALQRLQLLAEMRFTLIINISAEALGKIPLTIQTIIGEITTDQKTMMPMIEALAENNFEPKSINTLLTYPTLQHLNLSQACDMILFLCGICVEPTHDEETIARLKTKTDKLNTFLINQSQYHEHAMFLASPVTGSGIHAPRIHQLSLLAIRNGFSSIEAAVNFIWEILSSREQSGFTSGEASNNDTPKNVEELTLNVTSFLETRLPILTALKIS